MNLKGHNSIPIMSKHDSNMGARLRYFKKNKKSQQHWPTEGITYTLVTQYIDARLVSQHSKWSLCVAFLIKDNPWPHRPMNIDLQLFFFFKICVADLKIRKLAQKLISSPGLQIKQIIKVKLPRGIHN
ncbi:hypothetical protein V6Z11_D05G338800 [Gossypium hirsutum]